MFFLPLMPALTQQYSQPYQFADQSTRNGNKIYSEKYIYSTHGFGGILYMKRRQYRDIVPHNAHMYTYTIRQILLTFPFTVA